MNFAHQGHYITLISFLVGDDFIYFRFNDEIVTQISDDKFIHYSIIDEEETIKNYSTGLYYLDHKIVIYKLNSLQNFDKNINPRAR